MTEIINFLVIVAAVYFLIRIGLTLLVWRLEKQIVHIENAARAVESMYVVVEIEQANGQYFCYNAKTKDFVCQGHDMLEIVKNFKLRYPSKQGVIYNAETQSVTALDKDLKEVT